MGVLGRRSFLQRLAAAAAGVASIGMVDPEQLLWTPGKKTIIDLGATRQVLPATDAEMLAQAESSISLASAYDEREALLSDVAKVLTDRDKRDMRLLRNFVEREREVKLEIFDTDRQELRGFNYKGDELVGRYSPADLALLDVPFRRGMFGK
jgi:hypothetical protein